MFIGPVSASRINGSNQRVFGSDWRVAGTDVLNHHQESNN